MPRPIYFGEGFSLQFGMCCQWIGRPRSCSPALPPTRVKTVPSADLGGMAPPAGPADPILQVAAAAAAGTT